MTYKKDSRGEMVKRIQKALASAGLKVIADGIFGAITEEAVREFQRMRGLKIDGIVGPATLSKLGVAVVQQHTGLKKVKRDIRDIIIHCSATPEFRDYTVTDIRQMHLLRGFSDIGYHYVVYRDGSVHEGRNVEVIGAHTSGYNAHSIGVCYIGGVETDGKTPKDTRTQEQKTALLSLLRDLRRLYPKARIQGHRDYSPDLNGNGTVEPWEWIKYCPCFYAGKEYKDC